MSSMALKIYLKFAPMGKIPPWQARVLGGNTRCSSGVCLEHYGG